MSASTGPTSKGEKGKPKYQCLDINSIYNSTRSEASEAQTTKNTIPRKHGMQQLGKVPQRRPPANLPSLKSENSGNDPSVSLVPSGVQGWGLKPGETQQLSTGVGSLQSNQTNQSPGQTVQQNQNLSNQTSPAPAAGVISAGSLPPSQTQHQQTSQHQAQAQQSQDKTWSSVTGGGGAGQGGPGSGPADGGPSFLAHQSPLFRQEFPSLSGEPGAAPGLPPTTPAYGPGPSLRPQTEPTSWTHNKPSPQQQHPAQQASLIPSQFKSVVPSFMMSQGSGFPMFPESIQKKSRSQASAGAHPDSNRMNRMMGGVGGGGRGGGGANNGPAAEGEDLVLSRPIIREEELVKMDELARDPSWAATDDIDYNEQLSFSDGESIEDDKEKDFKFKDKCKPQPMRDDKKDDIDKMNRDKGFMHERERDRDKGQQPWRVSVSGGGIGMGSNSPSNYNDFRNPMPRQQMQGGSRIDDEEMWKEKRRQMHEHKQVVAEKAKQRKEEEEKRYEETARAKRNNRDEPGVDWEDRAKISGDNFRQMTQFPLESRSGLNREKDRDREMRRDRDRDGQFGGNQRFNQSRPPRFRKDGGGGKPGSQSSWPGHAQGSFLSRRNNDQIMDDQHDRFRGRDERDNRGSEGKRNYYDSQSMDHSQQYHERDYDRDYRSAAQSHHQQSDKDMGSRDVDKELRDSPKTDSDHRSFDDVRNRREPKQQNDHYEEKENEWRDKRGDYGNQGEASSERPSRPESRDSRVSRDLDHRPLVDSSDSFHDGYIADKMDKLTLSKDIRREPQIRGREHVPGPITQEKLTAYEHKHSQSQLEKSDGQEKDSEDKRNKRGEGESSTTSSQAWGEDKSLDLTSQAHLTATSPTSCLSGIVTSDIGRQSSDPLTGEEGKPDTDLDKRKENGGERLRDRRDDPGGGMKIQQGQGQHLGRNNRGSRGGGPRNNSYPSKYNSYQQQGPTWQHPKDRSRQQQGSRGRGKNWNHSESDGSGDEVSAESGKDDKKNEKKLDGGGKMGTWKSDNKDRRDDKKDSKKEQNLGGTDSDKEKIKDKKGDNRGGMSDSMSRKSADGGGFMPTGEVSRRGRGGMRGQSRLGMGPPALYGPPGSKPFSSAGGMGPHQTNSSSQLDSSHQPSSPPHHMGRKDDGGKGDKGQHRGKNARAQDENWETTSETSDGSEAKKPNKNRNSRLDRKRGGGGTIGDKRNLINSHQHHVNGKPDSEDRKSNKDDSDTSLQPYSNNGFQEVKSKKGGGKDGRGGTKEDGKQRSRSKNKEKMGGVKGQPKSFTREFVNNKPPRLMKLETSRKQQLAHGGSNSPDVSDMNKINQNVSSLFPIPRSSNVPTEVSCPPAHNAWNKPISSLRSTPPLGPATPLTQLTVASAQITQDKTTSLEEIGQVGSSAPSASPTAEKAIAKLNREAPG